MVPLVEGKVVIASDGDNSRGGYCWVGVSRDVGDGRVGQELHDHTNIIRHAGEHHRGLKHIITVLKTYQIHNIMRSNVISQSGFKLEGNVN